MGAGLVRSDPRPVQEVVIPYLPRKVWLPFHRSDARWRVCVAHRRAGKTVAMINECIKGAMTCSLPSPRFSYIAPFLNQSKAIAWDYLKHYARPRLLCIDEIGYLSYDNRNADLLYEVIARRYEQKSLVLTTNLAFADWPTIFPNASSATALIDRVIPHPDVTAIEGQSFRNREAEAARSRRARPKS